MAQYVYILEPRAQDEYEQATKWYQKRSQKAAVNFVNNIDFALDFICLQPSQQKNIFSNFYEIIIKNYPYSIIYTIEDSIHTIVVFSIHHHKRNPKKKYSNSDDNKVV